MQKYYFKTRPGKKLLGLISSEALEEGGQRILVSGFWGFSRHINYLGEIVMATALTLSLGHPAHFIPWLYPLYYVALLIPRQLDDDRRCQEKYGVLWTRYYVRACPIGSFPMSIDSSAIQIDSTTAADEPVLNRLMQLYAYDFSEFMGWDVAADELYFSGDPKVQARSEPGRYTFLMRRAGQLAGFAIVDERSRITGDAGVMDMAEFFVLRKYRRQGLGAQVATRLASISFGAAGNPRIEAQYGGARLLVPHD